MPKKKLVKPKREITKRQLSHWQRESRIQRFLFIGGIIVVVAVLAIVGTGIYMSKYKPYQAAAIRVDNKQYSMDYYIDTLAYLGILNGGTQLIPYMGDMAVTLIEQNHFYVREAASQFGISVSDEEVKADLEKNDLSGNTARNNFVRAQLLNTKLKDYFSQNTVPAEGDQREVKAMFLESQTQAEDVKQRIDNGEDFGDIAAQLSLESTSSEKRGDYGWVPQDVLALTIDAAENSIVADKAFSSEIVPGTLVTLEDPDRSKHMGYWLARSTDEPVFEEDGVTTIEPVEGDIHFMIMLLNSREKADEIKGLLEQGGEGNDFITLAKAHSQYTNATEDGGDMRYQTRDDLETNFSEEIADLFFNDDPDMVLPENQISDPIADAEQTTKGGVWLMSVSEKENRAIEGENRDILVNNKLQEWQTQVWNDNQDKVETIMTNEQKSWALTEAEGRALG
ncbi:MAG: peptidylprolyl isomerase [Dehalococcoidales bacterium]|nr:peptidylprolyl isomerase [Dehalococcoidales bacterium]